MKNNENTTVELPNGVILNEKAISLLKEWGVGNGDDTYIGASIDTLVNVQDYLSKYSDFLGDHDLEGKHRLLELLHCVVLLKDDLRSFLYKNLKS